MLAWWLEGSPGEELDEEEDTKASPPAAAVLLPPPLPPLLLLAGAAPPGVYTKHSSEELRSGSCMLRTRENTPLEGVVLLDQAIVGLLTHNLHKSNGVTCRPLAQNLESLWVFFLYFIISAPPETSKNYS